MEVTHYKNLSLEDLIENVDGEIRIEKWQPVLGFEQYYLVSSFGRIKSLYRETYRYREGKFSPTNILKYPEKILKQSILKAGGYCGVKLVTKHKRLNSTVHIIAALAFIPNPENKPEVNHKKGIKTDNRIWELEWNTTSENIYHAFRIGLKKAKKEFLSFGDDNPKSKKVNQYSLNGEFVKTFGGARDAQRITKIDASSIGRCCIKKQNTAGGFKWEYAEGYGYGRCGANKNNVGFKY